MLRLLEITYTDKESVALYDNFADETALIAEFETKLGQAMKAEAYKVEMLVAFGSDGTVVAQGYDSKDNAIALSPRLVFVTTKNGVETANQSKCADVNDLIAEHHIKKGTFMKDATVDSFMLMNISGTQTGNIEFWSRPIEVVEPQEQGE